MMRRGRFPLSALWSGRKEAVQLDREARRRRTGQRSTRPVERVYGKLPALVHGYG